MYYFYLLYKSQRTFLWCDPISFRLLRVIRIQHLASGYIEYGTPLSDTHTNGWSYITVYIPTYYGNLRLSNIEIWSIEEGIYVIFWSLGNPKSYFVTTRHTSETLLYMMSGDTPVGMSPLYYR